MIKKFVIMMSVGVAAVCAQAETETVNGITWTYIVSDGKASVGGGEYSSPTVSTSTSGAITIPSILGGYPVTGISDYAFYKCDSLTSVVIPDGITSIGECAFEDCRSLVRITVPGSVVSIGRIAFGWGTSIREVHISDIAKWCNINFDDNGNNPFENCELFFGGEKIVDLAIPEGVEYINSRAFSGCSSLKNVIIPSSVISIESEAFYHCNSLTNVTMLKGVSNIERDAFGACESLLSVTIPESVRHIGDGAFCGCISLASITIPGSVTTVGGGVFGGCSSLTNVIISMGITSIRKDMFNNCTSLTSVTIPEGVTNIEDEAFAGCRSLANIKIPASVSRIGFRVFELCGDKIYDRTSFPGLVLVDGWVIGYTVLPSGNLNLTGIRGIAGRAFDSCCSVMNVTFGDSVIGIGSFAFSGCHNLTNVTIPGNIKCIGEGAFGYCGSLTSVTIKEGVESILNGAFQDCISLTTLEISVSVKNLGSDVFANSPVGGRINSEIVKLGLMKLGMGSGSATSADGDARYDLADVPMDRSIANVTVDRDTSIDSFVLSDGKVFDSVLRIVNTSASAVKLTLPSGYEYETMKGARPLIIPPLSRNILTLTRVADGVFLVTREELESVQ